MVRSPRTFGEGARPPVVAPDESLPLEGDEM
jgi:hypothetical protein